MKDGFIAIASGVPKLRLGDCRANAEHTFALMRAADKAGARILVLPELGLTGATCGDLFWQDLLCRGAEEALATVLEATRHLELLAAVGLPLAFRGRLYDCAAVIQGGKILGLVPAERPAARQFTPAPAGREDVSLLGQTVPMGPEVLFACETVPSLTAGFAVGPMGAGDALEGAAFVGRLSAEAEAVGRPAVRRQLCAARSAGIPCAYAYAGAGEGESVADGVYGAHQMIFEDGRLLAERRLDGGLLLSEMDGERLSVARRRRGYGIGDGVPFSLPVRRTKLTRYVSPSPFVPEDTGELAERCREILDITSLALKRRLEHTGSKAAVIGLSGGLDSTLAALTAVRAMDLLGRPRTDIIGVTMPGFGTTGGTRDNAARLAECLGVTLRTVDITGAVLGHFRDIGHDPGDHNVAYENAQARERTQILMDIANDAGGLVIGTGDLSELALGWCTYNGDHMSMYAVNASIPKTLMRHLVLCASEGDGALWAVLRDILDTPISPELLPAVQGNIQQRTEDLVGPYELHDFFLYYLVRWGFSPGKILRLGEKAFRDRYSREALLKWMGVFCRRFFSQQFKRDCVPDGPRVGSVSLSPRGDWAMPSDASAALWLAELEALEGV